MTDNNPKTKPTNSVDPFLNWVELEMRRRGWGVNELRRAAAGSAPVTSRRY